MLRVTGTECASEASTWLLPVLGAAPMQGLSTSAGDGLRVLEVRYVELQRLP